MQLSARYRVALKSLGNALPHPNLSPLLRDRLVICSITCANNDMWVKNNEASRLESTKRTNRTSDNGGSLQQSSGLAKPAGRVVALLDASRCKTPREGSRRCRRFPIGHDVLQRSFSQLDRHLILFYKDAETIIFMSEDIAA
jgi:hypothetical protein